MSNSIIIHDSEELINLYSLNMNIFLGLDVISKESAAEAIELLDLIQFADVIILKAKIGNEDTIGIIQSWIEDNDKEILVIILDDKTTLDKASTFIKSDTDIKKAIAILATLMGIKPSNLNKSVVSEFYPVPISYFPLMEKAFCDIYHRSSKSDPSADSVYLKLYSANKKLEQIEIEKLKNLGTKNLYVLSSLRSRFAHFYTLMLVDLMEQDKSRGKKYKALEGARRVVAEEIKKYGINEKVIKIANASINSMFTDLVKEKSTRAYLEFLKEHTDGFLFQHTQMATYMSFQIIDNIDWGTEEQKKKITFVSFFHDITLPEDHLALIHNDNVLKSGELTKEETRKVNEHALEASELIRKYPHCPLGVDLIIRQHHGVHNGFGFKDPPAHDISPLAAVFMVAEEFSTIVLTDDRELSLKKICERLERTFPNHHKYMNCVEALAKIKY